ncbi:uncharacterized protein LOC133814803 [Humulus lupulus]|uniref:uncharacterized protein LOC133814803 n=1 Tax=Humulus lupulus TaxID=3486 RepID=UPI002B416CE8|nr:uncharacterized protein LOC133814803 [Humulus lupulus]
MADAQRWKSLGLADELRSIGSHYTWTHNQADGARIFSNLDRTFKNEEWMDLFPKSIVFIKWDIISDHCFCIVKAMTDVNTGFKPFRFFNMWTEHERFKAVVTQSWNKSISTHGLDRIMMKLKRLTHVLRQFNKWEIGDVEHKYQVAKENYNHAQYQLQQDPHSAEFQAEEHKSFVNLVQQTRFYDSYLRQRGKIIEKYEDVVAHFLHHFQSILGSQSKASGPIQKECFMHGNILSLEQQLVLIKPFSKKDVKNAMFSISSIKSPGPDGYGSGFFKAMWNELGDDISDAILGFFQQGSLPKGLNNAMLSLIPRVENSTKAVDYRPIACCNTLYKCISKMLCGRLNLILPLLIHQNQGAFVRDRLLAHNILIFQDTLKGYKRKHISPRCVMKVNLSKAYDSIDCQCLEDTLVAFYFPGQFINWVMVCLKDSSYSILMNGRVQGSFLGRKGLRQGDPVTTQNH